MIGEMGARVRRAWGLVCVTLGIPVAALLANAREPGHITIDPAAGSASAQASVAPAAMASVEPAAAAVPPPPRAPRDLRPTWVRDDEGNELALLFPPRAETAGSPRPVVIAFHGICGHPAWHCQAFAAAAEDAWLLCPRAKMRCSNGGGTWSNEENAAAIDALVDRAAAEHPGEMESAENRVLIGFSLGAQPAAAIAQRGAGHYSGLVLMGADVSLDAGLLKRAGVRHVVTASGEYDMMRGVMGEVAGRLKRAGLDASFLSLGKMGHAIPSSGEWLTEAMSRMRGGAS